jgi:signal transduction histidine kinase/ligand-binding sensor domain-containing protein
MPRPNQACVWFAFMVFGSCNWLVALDQPLSQLYHTPWGARQGVTGIVTALAQTSDGYLWVATTAGLLRFDGISFERYQPESGALLGNVSTMMAVPGGGLWVGYFRGGVTFLKDGRATNYTDADDLPVSTVRGFARDGSGTIWVAAVGGLARLEGGRWVRHLKGWNYPGLSAWALLVGRQGTLWVASDNQIVFLRQGQRRFETTGIQTGEVSLMTQAPDGTIVFYDDERKKLRSIRGGASDTTSIPVAVNAGLFDRDGALWVGGEGLSRVLPGSKDETERFTEAQGLSGRNVEAIFEDREGNIWTGTDGGLDRFRHRNVTWFPLRGGPFALVAGAGGDVWAGSRGEKFPIIRIQDHKPAGGATDVLAVYRDADGSVWYSANHALLHWQDGRLIKIPVPRQVQELSLSTSPPAPIMASAITKDRAGSLWVAFGGSGEFRLTKGVWSFVPILPDHPDWSASYSFTDGDDRIWLLWGDRVAQYDHGRIQIFGARDGLTIGPPNVITERKQVMWLGAESGLAYLQGGRFHTVQSGEDSGFNSVTGIVAPPNDGLWLATSSGIIHIPASEVERVTAHPEHKVSFELFDLASDLPDPLQWGGVYAPGAIQAGDGRIWFATRNGAVSLDPAHIYRNPLPPPVSIRSIAGDDRTYSPFSQPALPALTRSLRIEYDALSLSIPERVRFRYKLEPLDKDWREAQGRREVSFDRIPPGKYAFRVVACNNDGVWNMAGTALPLTVAPAWFQTNWFRASWAGIALLLLWMLYRMRLKQLERRFNLALEARVDERTRIARELHDTLLQSFQGLMLRLQLVDDLLPQGRAKEQLEQSLERADEAIAEGRTAVYALRSSTMAANDLTGALTTLGEELSTPETAFHVVVEGPARELHPVIRDEFYRIAREALRNAFSHARAHHIEVEITYGERLFRLRIRDDGGGIPAEIVETGRAGHYGLRGMRERARQIGSKLEIWSGAGRGTEIDLRVPGSIAYGKPSSSRPRLFRRKVDSK